MIISKGNLQVSHLTSKDKDIEALDNIHICKDGTTISCANNAVIAVSPVRLQIKDKLKQLKDTALNKGITVGIQFVNKLIKNMPKDSMFKGLLEHCNIKDSESNKIEATFHDGASPFTIQGHKYKGTFSKFRSILRSVFNRQKENSTKVIIDRERLYLLLDTIKKICPNNSQDVIFLEFTDDYGIIIRAINQLTGQKVVSTMKTFKFSENNWVNFEKWENSLTKEEKTKVQKNKYYYKRRS